MLPSSGHEREDTLRQSSRSTLVSTATCCCCCCCYLLLLPPPLLLLLLLLPLLHADIGLARVAVEPHVRFRPLPHKHARPCRRLGVARLDWGTVVALEAGVEIWVAVAARPPGAQPAEGRAGGASNSTSSSNNKASR